MRPAAIELVQGDITEQHVDAIVNAANARLVGGGGVDGAIHRAGGPAIMAACGVIRDEAGGCPPGTAVATTAGNLAARAVIHTVGPVWSGGLSGEPEVLASAYRSSLAAARSGGFRSVAFPSISTGVYGYPIEKAAPLALGAVYQEIARTPDDFDTIRFVLFSEADLAAYTAALRAVCDGRG